MNDLNKKFIDTEELQSEITKLKNLIINSLTDKNTADTAVVKTDLANINSFNEDILNSIKGINLKIADLYAKAKAKELNNTSIKVVDLKTRINTINTQRTPNDEELKKEITQLEKYIDDLLKTADSAIKTATEGLDKKITETNTKINEVKSDLSGEIKKVDDKLNIFYKTVPFQFKVSSIIATNQVEI